MHQLYLLARTPRRRIDHGHDLGRILVGRCHLRDSALLQQWGHFDYADKVNFSAALGDPSARHCRCSATTQAGNPQPAAHYRGAVLWVISPLAAIVLPTLAWRLLSTMESYWASTWHYSLVLMPIVFLALL